MNTPVTQVELRITCSEVSVRNDYGKPKLIAKIDTSGINVWCRHCRQAHLIPREQCEAAWAKGESVVKACEQEQVL